MREDLKFISDRHKGATAAHIRALERHIGYALPDDYREFLLKINGGQLAEQNNVIKSPWNSKHYFVDILYSLCWPEREANSIMEALWLMAGQIPANLLPIGTCYSSCTTLLVLSGNHQAEVFWRQFGAEAEGNLDPERFADAVDANGDHEYVFLARNLAEFLNALEKNEVAE